MKKIYLHVDYNSNLSSKSIMYSSNPNIFLSIENEVIEFFVRATDKGSPPRENNAPVEIYIMSPDDVAPAFPQDSYSYFISEDREVGIIIATVVARSDEPVTYTIVSGAMPYTNNPAKFEVSDNGEITLMEELDREELETYELTVMAATQDTPPLVAYCHVTVHIHDVNDNPPKFESSPYTVSR